MRSQTQRVLLFGFIASISLCALVGIYCLLVESQGPLQGRVLASTATFALASILALAAAIPWERRIWHPVGLAGGASVAVALTLGLIAIWWVGYPGDGLMKTLGIACVFGIGLPHVGLLALARLRPGYVWVRRATVIALAVLGGQLIITILAEPREDLWVRIIGVVAILSVCGTVAVPILHRISAIPRSERPGETSIGTIADRVALTCPRCGHTQELPRGRASCGECRLGIRIEIDA